MQFTEIAIDLFKGDSSEKLGMYSPSLKVPVLIHNDIKVWDSLPICEYISETFVENKAWPCHLKKKAAARSVVAELHSDFQHFKQEWPMNCSLHVKMAPDEKLAQEIAADAIMYCCRRKYGDGGKYLFGRFSIADAFMAPVVITPARVRCRAELENKPVHGHAARERASAVLARTGARGNREPAARYSKLAN